MLLGGALNTIFLSAANNTRVPSDPCPSTVWTYLETRSRDCADGPPLFRHPPFQAIGMFLGEALCGAVFVALKRRGMARQTPRPYKVRLLLLPTACDLCATLCNYAALSLTHPSVYQMLRGTVVLFTAAFSRVFLRRRLFAYHVLGLATVVVGAVVVGGSAMLNEHPDRVANAQLGVLILLAGQLFGAGHMTAEEALLVGPGLHPLSIVGWEGVLGLPMLGALLAVFSAVRVDGLPLEDVPVAAGQVASSAPVALALAGSVVALSVCNMFGVTLTKKLSAAHRVVADTCRALVVWGVGLVFGWDQFRPLQLLGFAVLVLGTAIYNKAVRVNGFYYPPSYRQSSGMTAALLGSGRSSLNLAIGANEEDEDTLSELPGSSWRGSEDDTSVASFETLRLSLN